MVMLFELVDHVILVKIYYMVVYTYVRHISVSVNIY